MESRGMTVNYHFPDNLARSIQHTGRILLEWIPKYYDTQRVVRIIGEDGEEQKVKLNPEQETSVAPEMNEFEKEIGKIYNLNVGTYDVTVSTGPSYAAKRQEAVDNQLKIVEARPEMLPIIGDILFSNMDAPGSEEISERLKVLLPPEIKQAEQAEDQDIDPAVAAAMQQVEEMAKALEAKGQELATMQQLLNDEAAKISANKSEINAAKKDLDADQKVFAANVKQQMSELKLMGEKLRQDMEDAVDPLVEQLKCQDKTKAEMPDMTTEEALQENQQDRVLQDAIQALAEYQANASLMLQENLTKSVEELAGMLSKPRMTAHD